MTLRPLPTARRALVAAILLLTLPHAWSQAPANGLPPELAPLAAKYQSDLAALNDARTKAVAPLRQTYLTTLTAAAQKATTENKPDEAKAANAEKDAVTAGQPLAAVAAPLLPRTLAVPRAAYLRDAARLDRDYDARAQQIATEYLRGLDFYETRARTAGQTALLQQIQAEKQKLAKPGAGGANPAHGPAQNLAANGDFAEKKENGLPKVWNAEGATKGAVATEQGTTFLRVICGDRKQTAFMQSVDRPPAARELQVSVRLRCRDAKVPGTYGLIVAQRDGEDKLVARDRPCILSTASPTWKTLTGTVVLHPETKRLVIRCDMVDAISTVDFADVHVEPH